MNMEYGKPPVDCGSFEDINLNEVMYYLYLPVFMAEAYSPDRSTNVRLPKNLEGLRSMIFASVLRESDEGRKWRYIYVSARKGWATPDNPLNRPGWHTDGFGSPDVNYIWWSGPGTRFWLKGNLDSPTISDDHIKSMEEFEELTTRWPGFIKTFPAKRLYQIDRYVIHATPVLTKGCMRQFVKISFSNERYNLYNNSHNYEFDYDWPMVDRDVIRNDPVKAQLDYGG